MVEARETYGPLPRAWTLATVAALGMASVGCTMCPDPFDYSGPVPNGSSPQNDFRARSNGILPLGAASKPWPLLVKGGDGADVRPRDDDEHPPVLAEDPSADGAEANDVEQTVAVLGESDDDGTGRQEAETAGDGTNVPQHLLEAVPVADEWTESGNAESGNAPTQPVQVVRGEQPPPAAVTQDRPAAPASQLPPPVQIGETPGWRARRR